MVSNILLCLVVYLDQTLLGPMLAQAQSFPWPRESKLKVRNSMQILISDL